MNKEQLQKLDNLTLDLNMDLEVLNNAVRNSDDDLTVCSLINFMGEVYKISNEIRDIFDNSLG